jgi:hypothetical protein
MATTTKNSFLVNLEQALGLIPTIIMAVQAFKDIGHSKDTTVQKIGDIVQISAAIGEVVPIPQVQSISAIIESIATQVFTPTPTTASPAGTAAIAINPIPPKPDLAVGFPPGTDLATSA